MRPGPRPACLLPCSNASSIPPAPGLAAPGWQKEGSPVEPGPVSLSTFDSVPAFSHPTPSPEHPWDSGRAERQPQQHPEGVPGRAPGKGVGSLGAARVTAATLGGCLSLHPPRRGDSEQHCQQTAPRGHKSREKPPGMPSAPAPACTTHLPVYLEASPPRSAGAQPGAP